MNEIQSNPSNGHTESSESFLANLLHRMDPRVCLVPHYDDPDHFDSMVRSTLEDLADETSRHQGLERLFHETDLAHQRNRVPMVCTSQWDIVCTLAKCLARADDRRLACLTLNNLSIPFENKSVMAFGSSASILLDSALHVIQNDQPEAYLCLILLMNLSFLDDAKSKLVQYSSKGEDPLESPTSLLRTIELLLKAYSRFLTKPVVSVEGEAVRWAIGLVRNLTSIEEGACLVSQTHIPQHALTYVRDSPKPLHEWTHDSLEDMSLQVLVNLVANSPQSAKRLKSLETRGAFDSIVGQGGIHDVRASFLQVQLQ